MTALNSKEWICIVVLTAIVLLAAIRFWPTNRERAREYSGPGIGGNLFNLERIKECWEVDHKGGNAWPTWQDLAPYADTTNFHMIPVYHEIYLINRTDAPAFAYFPKTEYGFHEGQTISLDDEEMKKVKQFVRGNVDERPNNSLEPTATAPSVSTKP